MRRCATCDEWFAPGDDVHSSSDYCSEGCAEGPHGPEYVATIRESPRVLGPRWWWVCSCGNEGGPFYASEEAGEAAADCGDTYDEGGEA